MSFHFPLQDGQGFCPYEKEEIWWLILRPLISCGAYTGFWHCQWMFAARVCSCCKAHMFLEMTSCSVPIRKQNYCSYFSHWDPGLQWYGTLSASLRLSLSCHFHSCLSLTLWRKESVNQEILPDTKLFRAKTLCGCTQLLPQASRRFNQFSTNIPFPVEQTKDSTGCCQPGCIS